MQIPVLIEPIADNRYRARGGEPLALTAEGPTPEAALSKLREQLQIKLRNGAEIAVLEVTPGHHPLAEFVGMFKGDPGIADWKKAMAKYRRKVDQQPDTP